MKKIILILVISFTTNIGLASSGGAGLDHVEVSLSDKVSLQNGAKIFVNYCMSCHSAKYMRYNRMASDLDIPEALVKKHMLTSGQKIGDAMTTTMSKEAAEEWFGVAPPDLSLVAKLRGTDWLYSYMRSFYIDETTASGWNNTIFSNVAMPNVLHELQGIQKGVVTTQSDQDGNEHEVIEFEQVTPGTMNAEEFDHAMADLTNFLYYMAEPVRMVRIKYGMWTMLFLGVFGFLAYMLKKEYWRDVH